ncbi:MAG TPA: hypothetical protein VE777_19330, partial [Gaiellales bacterium]|nr:hypothetical protein [Gaiellales bacterium]
RDTSWPANEHPLNPVHAVVTEAECPPGREVDHQRPRWKLKGRILECIPAWPCPDQIIASIHAQKIAAAPTAKHIVAPFAVEHVHPMPANQVILAARPD